jgi:hypothetical protein
MVSFSRLNAWTFCAIQGRLFVRIFVNRVIVFPIAIRPISGRSSLSKVRSKPVKATPKNSKPERERLDKVIMIRNRHVMPAKATEALPSRHDRKAVVKKHATSRKAKSAVTAAVEWDLRLYVAGSTPNRPSPFAISSDSARSISLAVTKSRSSL